MQVVVLYTSSMSFLYEQQSSSSKLVEVIWKTVDTSDGTYIAPADGCWDLIFITRDNQTRVLFSGPTTKPTNVPYQAGNTNVGIRFKPAAFMPSMSATTMQDRVDILPMVNDHTFTLFNQAFTVPTYESADSLVHELEELGFIGQDHVINTKLQSDIHHMTERSVQRHFKQRTGLPAKSHQQIQQAQNAVELLRSGQSPLVTAQETGYADQAHLTRSLKKFTGRTPAEIIATADPIIVEKRT